MSHYNTHFNDVNSEDDGNHLNEEINACRNLIESNLLYNSVERVEDVINQCLDYGYITDGLYFVNYLLEISPYNSELWNKKGLLLNFAGNFEQAIECIEKALSLNPGDLDILIDKSAIEENLGNFSQAEEILNSVLRNEPNNEDALFSLGLLNQRRENFAKAIHYFEKVIKQDPTYNEALYELGY
ncbi:MAG: tetratricopeptide repeat protein, partial [Ignavibacteriaceae bacterium]